jgi:hypothetical protein
MGVKPSGNADVTVASHSANPLKSFGSHKVIGPTNLRKSIRATLGSSRRSAFHCSAR